MQKWPSIYTQISQEVLSKMKQNFMNYKNTPFCFIETSHRSKEFAELNKSTMEVMKSYFNAEEYQCLMMPSGTAIASLFFNLSQCTDNFIFLSEGRMSQKSYRQMKKYRTDTVKMTSSKQIQSFIDGIQSKKQKIVLHYHKIQNGKLTKTPKILKEEKQSITVVECLNYCFPWAKDQRINSEIAYFESQTGLSTCGFTVIFIKKTVLQSLKIKWPIPDMLSFHEAYSKNSIVNTPFTLCTLTAYHNIKNAFENQEKVIEKVVQNKAKITEKLSDFKDFLLVQKCELEKEIECENMLVIKILRNTQSIMNQIVENGYGWKIDENHFCCFIQQSNEAIPLMFDQFI